MAVVYKAEDAILGREVALKTLRQSYVEELTFLKRFKREARAMASLDHPKIVRVYDISQEDNVPFIVAECVEGEDAGERLSRVGRMEVADAVRIAEHLLEALSYAHGQGIIHRDIKPSNIMLTGGSIKVADFGIARIVEESLDGDHEELESGEVIGSARYMSPEQLMGEPATPRSDLYSVGILLYHCLTGEPPFSGDNRSVARQQIHRDPLPPRRLNRKIPQGVEDVILTALSKDPSDRQASADAMLRSLRKERPAKGFAPAFFGRLFGDRKRSLATAAMVAVILSGIAAAGVSGYVSDSENLAASRSSGGGASPDSPPAPPAQTAQTTQDTGAEKTGGGFSVFGAFGGSDESTSETASGGTSGETSGGGTDTSSGGTSSEADYVTVPDVDAYYDYYAEEVLAQQGLETKVVYDYHEGYTNKGVTWGTDPLAGESVPEGSTVTIYATPKDQPQPQF
jgi:serine/threonine-protein kinase